MITMPQPVNDPDGGSEIIILLTKFVMGQVLKVQLRLAGQDNVASDDQNKI